MVKKWKLISSKPLFQSPYLELYQDQLERNGELVGNFYSVKRKNWVEVVALTDEKELVVVRQFRNGVKDVIWGLPAGFVEVGEDEVVAASRELEEETGFRAQKFVSLGTYASNPGFSGELMIVFLATGAKKVQKQNLDQHEDIEVKLFPFRQILNQIKEKESIFVDSPSILSILLAEKELFK